MTGEKNRFRDELRASSITTRSTLAHALPWLPKRHVGSNDDNYVPVRWRRAFIPDEVTDDLILFMPEADPTAVAQLTADKKRLDEMAHERNGLPAVIYSLSREAVKRQVMLAGILEFPLRDKLFHEDPEDPTRYAVGIRGLRQELAAGIGVFEPDRRRFWPVHDELSERAVVPSAANTLPVVQRQEV